jgi:O-antigen ligase
MSRAPLQQPSPESADSLAIARLSLWGRVHALASASWLDQASVESRHRSQFAHRLGRFGHPIHAGLAMFWCAGVVGPIGSVEIAGVLVLGCFLARLPFVRRGVRDALAQPATILLLLWAAWVWVLAWREGFSAAAVHEASYQRWGPALVLLWAVMDRRRALIVAICVGFALAQGAQLLEFVGHAMGVPALVWSHPPAPDPSARISGWWHQPAVGGTMLVACLGLHLGPAFLGAGRTRVLAAIACGATMLALLATGTRGAWLAGGALACGVAGAWVVLHARERGSWRGVALALAGVAIALGAVLALDGPRARAASLATEARAAWVQGDLDSDVGGRVLAARAALDAVGKNPLVGIGPGGFNAHARAYAQREGVSVAPFRLEHLKTAHNTLLHVGATQGVIGVLLLFGAIACALFAGLRPCCGVGAATLREHLGSYAGAPGVALLGLVFAGAFDTTTLNASTAALSTILIALCPVVRPRDHEPERS